MTRPNNQTDVHPVETRDSSRSRRRTLQDEARRSAVEVSKPFREEMDEAVQHVLKRPE